MLWISLPSYLPLCSTNILHTNTHSRSMRYIMMYVIKSIIDFIRIAYWKINLLAVKFTYWTDIWPINEHNNVAGIVEIGIVCHALVVSFCGDCHTHCMVLDFMISILDDHGILMCAGHFGSHGSLDLHEIHCKAFKWNGKCHCYDYWNEKRPSYRLH